jgi:hypothetical protein
MDLKLKSLSVDAIPRALAKAERYRFLGEPEEAQSICLDALAVDADNQEALTTLVLALTDQFDRDQTTVAQAYAAVSRLQSEYERCYYMGLIHVRRARALLRARAMRGGPRAYEWLHEAMASFERAEAIRPPNNDDAVLRWNACARLLVSDPRIVPAFEEPQEPLLLE